MDSSPRSYLFTSGTVRIPVDPAPISSRFFCPRPPLLLSNQNRHATQANTASKCGTEPIRYVTVHFRDGCGTASLRYRNCAETVRICEQKPYPVWFSYWRKSDRVWFSGITREPQTSRSHVTRALPSGLRFEVHVCTAGPHSRGK